jgi:hypothetical protein
MSQEQELLQRAAAEITSLRRQNEIMSARLSTFDSMMVLFNTEPRYPSQGMSEDVVWQINKFIESSKQQ